MKFPAVAEPDEDPQLVLFWRGVWVLFLNHIGFGTGGLLYENSVSHQHLEIMLGISWYRLVTEGDEK